MGELGLIELGFLASHVIGLDFSSTRRPSRSHRERVKRVHRIRWRRPLDSKNHLFGRRTGHQVQEPDWSIWSLGQKEAPLEARLNLEICRPPRFVGRLRLFSTAPAPSSHEPGGSGLGGLRKRPVGADADMLKRTCPRPVGDAVRRSN